MDQKVSNLLIFALFFVKSITSVATITPFVTITNQACPTLQPSCNGSAIILNTVVAQVAITDYDGNILLNEYVRPDAPKFYWRTSRDYLYINGNYSNKLLFILFYILNKSIFRNQPCANDIKSAPNSKGQDNVGFNLFNDITGLWILNSPDMLRDVELCPKYKLANGETLSLKAAVQMDLNRTIQQSVFHDALEDALATMELFRVNRDFWDDMIPTSLNLMSAMLGREYHGSSNQCYWNYTEIYYAEARNFTDVQRSVINETESKIIIGYRLLPSIKLLKLDHKYEKMRELQRSPPIRFDPILRNNPPSLDVFVKNELNISLLDNGLPST
ncbi:RNA exonuclease 4 [Gigaspora margarita]|uniref:RNA exonuclease 4 n=1 Tax=Gigaspora margarita TaxID=4874 RepID=A0A8H3XNT8_GIGMA|nr:RNA exonuclease 4 [Gigaspora margarita]